MNYLHHNNPKSRQEVNNLMNTLNLKDVLGRITQILECLLGEEEAPLNKLGLNFLKIKIIATQDIISQD